jgi:hypothetical protein
MTHLLPLVCPDLFIELGSLNTGDGGAMPIPDVWAKRGLLQGQSRNYLHE